MLFGRKSVVDSLIETCRRLLELIDRARHVSKHEEVYVVGEAEVDVESHVYKICLRLPLETVGKLCREVDEESFKIAAAKLGGEARTEYALCPAGRLNVYKATAHHIVEADLPALLSAVLKDQHEITQVLMSMEPGGLRESQRA